MCADFNSLEIFEIAEQIELNGVAFYTAAAEKFADKGLRQFMLEFAEMESNHARDFNKMKTEAQNSRKGVVVFDPDNEMAYYLKAMAASAGWEGKASPRTEFDGTETPAEILKMAIQAEKSSIDYYLGLKEFVDSELDGQLVERIIKEEMIHAAKLQRELERMA